MRLASALSTSCYQLWLLLRVIEDFCSGHIVFSKTHASIILTYKFAMNRMVLKLPMICSSISFLEMFVILLAPSGALVLIGKILIRAQDP